MPRSSEARTTFIQALRMKLVMPVHSCGLAFFIFEQCAVQQLSLAYILTSEPIRSEKWTLSRHTCPFMVSFEHLLVQRSFLFSALEECRLLHSASKYPLYHLFYSCIGLLTRLSFSQTSGTRRRKSSLTLGSCYT